jgi:hypothetical protein
MSDKSVEDFYTLLEPLLAEHRRETLRGRPRDSQPAVNVRAAVHFAGPLLDGGGRFYPGQHNPLVYFIQENIPGFTKIGCTTDIVRRMRTLQCGNPRGLCLVAYFRGGRDSEAKVHRFLKSRRIKGGEWFHPLPIIDALIADIVKNGMRAKTATGEFTEGAYDAR